MHGESRVNAARCIVRIESAVDLNFAMGTSDVRTHLRLSKSPTHFQNVHMVHAFCPNPLAWP
jgi:hypothetical protein